MPLFLCRWPNGDCSVVWARNTEDAIAPPFRRAVGVEAGH